MIADEHGNAPPHDVVAGHPHYLSTACLTAPLMCDVRDAVRHPKAVQY